MKTEAVKFKYQQQYRQNVIELRKMDDKEIICRRHELLLKMKDQSERATYPDFSHDEAVEATEGFVELMAIKTVTMERRSGDSQSEELLLNISDINSMFDSLNI